MNERDYEQQDDCCDIKESISIDSEYKQSLNDLKRLKNIRDVYYPKYKEDWGQIEIPRRLTEDQYRQYLNDLKELKIIRDRYYSDYPNDWMGGSTVSVVTKTLSSALTYITFFDDDIKGIFALSIRSQGDATGFDSRLTFTDYQGNVGVETSLFNLAISRINDPNTVGTAIPPFTHLKVEARSGPASIDFTLRLVLS